jgi:hypothetical protein
MRRRLVRVAFVVAVMSAVFAGSAIAVNPGPTQFPLVPAVQATVRDMCTGLSLPGFVASLVDSTGTSSAPSKVTAGGFQFLTLPDAASLTLSVSAPGYDPLGDPAAPKPATFTAKFRDLATGAPIAAGTINLVPNTPGVPAPAPITITNGHIKVSALACGAYTMNIDTPGYTAPPAGSVAFMQHGQPCDASVASGTATISSVAIIVLGPLGYNRAPQIDTITSDGGSISGTHNPVVGATVYAHDPDPGETALLTYNWTVTGSNGVTCSVFGATSATAAFGPCSGGGSGGIVIKITVTDPHGASDSEGFGVMVLP